MNVITLKPPTQQRAVKETPFQKRKRLERRNRYRDTVCRGCRNNFYNWPKPSDGWNAAVPDDYSCWYIGEIRRGKCPMHR